MDEYIKREEAIEAVKHAWAKGLEPSQYIEIIPAADVSKVRHGQWIAYVNEYGEKRHYCSECKKDAHRHYSEYRNDVIELLFDYCPNCGADMRGSNDE